MRLKIRQPKELKVFNGLRLSVVILTEILLEVLAEVLAELAVELLIRVLVELLIEAKASLVIYCLDSSVN